ncbi:MAG TPA: chemotaxis-specific protein-glutamate methyltransferase CheB [Anaeromyxobacteraceae bacterium]|nr:chemotaxis-specific protein-glutamate methyltransferase CheB [Anaeromyxobacteraceae bacterium]
MTGTQRIRVLVVDDSAFARKVIRDVLSAQPDLDVVGTARDGLEALEKVGELLPDVVTLDLAMPNLDGLGVLAALRGRAAKVVVVSIAGSSSEQGLAALDAGAAEVVHKPTALATDRLFEMSGDLVRAVRAASVARPPAVDGPDATPRLAAPLAATKRVVVIGASTGGPNAVSRLLKALPADFPVPIAVVLHLPTGYTGPYAERLDGLCALTVREAEDGMPLAAGTAVIARAGYHLKIREEARALFAVSDLSPVRVPHRPSVDVLFASAAETTGPATLGVVLTGMGDDGLEGSRAIRAAGGEILTETEASCVVYGMPRSVWEAGLATAEAPLSRMAAEVLARS